MSQTTYVCMILLSILLNIDLFFLLLLLLEMVSVYARIFDWMSSHITKFWPILSVFGVGFLCQIFGIEFTTNTGTHKVPNNPRTYLRTIKSSKLVKIDVSRNLFKGNWFWLWQSRCSNKRLTVFHEWVSDEPVNSKIYFFSIWIHHLSVHHREL